MSRGGGFSCGPVAVSREKRRRGRVTIQVAVVSPRGWGGVTI